MKLPVVIAVIVLVAGSAVVSLLLFTGPHMTKQPHVLPYQDSVAAPAPGAVPVEGNGLWPEDDSALLKPPEAAASAAGKTYYGYYCAFCHGENGDGNGPVGQSIVPKPSDLRDSAIRAMSDSVLSEAMLNGEGHTVMRDSVRRPVLARIIPPAQIPAIVQYVRELER